MPTWTFAFLTATLVALVATPRLRRVAFATGFVDKPMARKDHPDATPYLGGVAIMLGVLAGILLENHLRGGGAILVVAAALLGAIGLLDDDRSVSPALRLAAEVGAAGAAVAMGVRIHASGSTAVDIGITIVWIVGMTNALNFLDNMDGLAGGVASIAAFGVFALAILGGEAVIAVVAAATAGACLGFLAYNRPPATIFMGDAGSLFLGFVLSILTIDVSPQLAPPVSFIIPLMLLALPVLDTTVVTLARLRHGLSVSEGGKDHLSHRLVRTGMSRARAVGLLVGVEAVLVALAVLAGRRVLSLWVAVILAAAALGYLGRRTIRVRIYDDLEVVGFPDTLKRALIVAAIGVPVAAAPALIAMARAVGPARSGASTARHALATLGAGDTQLAADQFALAARQFSSAEHSLRGPLPMLGLSIPGLSSNFAAAKVLASVGHQLAVAGVNVSHLADPSQLPIQDGVVALDRLEALRPTLETTASRLKDSRSQLRHIERAFLLPPLQDAVDELAQDLAKKEPAVTRAAEAAKVLPGILGGDGTRHYFVAFQNNAELRGSGGLIGNWGDLEADGGRLHMGTFGRLVELQVQTPPDAASLLPRQHVDRWSVMGPSAWQQINVSPDFPTTGKAISTMYPASGGGPVDGVIGIDPIGLSALLELTGPLTVEGWPEPISSANVVDITLRQAYVRFPTENGLDTQRIDFLSNVAKSVIDAVTSANLGSAPRILAAMSKAVSGRHLMMYFSRDAEQKLARDIGADGTVPPVQGDSLLVVNQNMAANKIDAYLHREVRYDVTLRPDGNHAALSGTIGVTLTNAVPSLDLPPAVVGPYTNAFTLGENRSYLSVYSPFLTPPPSSSGGSGPSGASKVDLDRLTQNAVVSLGAGETKTLSFPVKGEIDLASSGWYRLDLPIQPTLNGTRLDLAVHVPRGWRIAEAHGTDRPAGRTTTARIDLDVPETVWIRVEPTGLHRLFEKFFGS